MIFLALTLLGAFNTTDLSLEQKIGQLLVVHFRGEEANEEAQTLINKAHIGGVIYYNWANGLHSPQQVQNLSEGLQKLSPIPLLIAVDQEGGLVTRLHKGFTQFPGNKALAMTGNPDLAEQAAFFMGQELASVGINFNLAPVVDVNSNPLNPIIGIRSFSDDQEIVTRLAEQALNGFHRAHIITCLKHFPGHGDVALDSHVDLPFLSKSIHELNSIELIPFKKLADKTETIMTAHLMVPALDPDKCATLSPTILSLLRQEMDFQGLIITDSLVMQSVLKNCGGTVEEAAIRAFLAGADLLLLGGKALIGTDTDVELNTEDILRVHQSLIQAVLQGRISEERLNESVDRILSLKNRPVPKTSFLNQASAQKLADHIATLSLQTTLNKTIPPLPHSRLAIFAPELAKENLSKTTLQTHAKETTLVSFKALQPTWQEAQNALAVAEKADILLICTFNAWKNEQQKEMIQMLINTGKPVILFCLSDSIDATLFPTAHQTFCTFSPAFSSLQAACNSLSATQEEK